MGLYQWALNLEIYPMVVGLPERVRPNELKTVRALVNQLSTALTADDINAEKERELKKRIADVQYQLEPFEEVSRQQTYFYWTASRMKSGWHASFRFRPINCLPLFVTIYRWIS